MANGRQGSNVTKQQTSSAAMMPRLNKKQRWRQLREMREKEYYNYIIIHNAKAEEDSLKLYLDQNGELSPEGDVGNDVTASFPLHPIVVCHTHHTVGYHGNQTPITSKCTVSSNTPKNKTECKRNVNKCIFVTQVRNVVIADVHVASSQDDEDKSDHTHCYTSRPSSGCHWPHCPSGNLKLLTSERQTRVLTRLWHDV